MQQSEDFEGFNNNTSSAIKSQNNDDSECRSALLGAASE